MLVIAATSSSVSWKIENPMNDRSALPRIPETRIEIPGFLMCESGDWYSVPGHPLTPKRKWRHARLDYIQRATDDDGLNPNFDFVRFCEVRDSAKEMWRLPACQGGCNWCWGHRWQTEDPSIAEDLADQMTVRDTCDYDWWVPVEEGLATCVPHDDPTKSTLTIKALPWTDFIIRAWPALKEDGDV